MFNKTSVVRTVKLRCLSSEKAISLLVSAEDKLNLGTIGRPFGLSPSTVKMNSHYISRGADHISTCVTWRSLLNFFASKGLPTGIENDEPILVDGKLFKLGGKLSEEDQHSPTWSGVGYKRSLLTPDTCSAKKLKINNSSDSEVACRPCTVTDGRNVCSHASNSMKRMRGDEPLVADPHKRIR